MVWSTDRNATSLKDEGLDSELLRDANEVSGCMARSLSVGRSRWQISVREQDPVWPEAQAFLQTPGNGVIGAQVGQLHAPLERDVRHVRGEVGRYPRRRRVSTVAMPTSSVTPA